MYLYIEFIFSIYVHVHLTRSMGSKCSRCRHKFILNPQHAIVDDLSCNERWTGIWNSLCVYGMDLWVLYAQSESNSSIFFESWILKNELFNTPMLVRNVHSISKLITEYYAQLMSFPSRGEDVYELWFSCWVIVL